VLITASITGDLLVLRSAIVQERAAQRLDEGYVR
jgi:hypothetical protein